jgi:hypothetical protein
MFQFRTRQDMDVLKLTLHFMLAICLAHGGELYEHRCQSQTPALTNEQGRCRLGNKPNSVQFVNG